MLSICIPIYNYDVRELVEELHKQADLSGKIYEILLIEDGSAHFLEENRKVQNLSNVSYVVLKENIGRAKIRNLLAEKAKYPYLIFMDCDAKITDNQYIKNYIDALPAEVVIGGCSYYQTPPVQKEHQLRWHFGIRRETRSASDRNINPYKSFSTFNFLIKKDLFEKIRFDENISGYGHEDTLFGYMLKKQGITVRHIENPLIHQISDETDIFLQKTENSIRNLWLLYQTIDDKKEFAKDNHLLKLYVFLQKYRLTKLVGFAFKQFRPRLEKNLLSEKPNIRIFDFYKLGILNEFC